MVTNIADPRQKPAGQEEIRIHPDGVLKRLRAKRSDIVNSWYKTQFDSDRLRRYAIAGGSDLSHTDANIHFLAPLLELLFAYLQTGESRYRDVYLDERLRYAPHKADPKVRQAFFEEVIPADEEALLKAIAGTDQYQDLSVWLRSLHAPLLEKARKDTIRLLAVGDCLLNEVRVFLYSRAADRNIPLDMRCAYFSASVGKDLASVEVEAMMAATPFDVIAFSFFTYEGLPPYSALMRESDKLSGPEIRARVQSLIGLVESYLARVREKTDAPFLLHNISGLPLTGLRRRLPFVPPLSRNRRLVRDELNIGLRQIADGIPNVLLIDECEIAERFGLRNATVEAIPQELSRDAYFHTARFGEPLADAYADVLASFRDLRKTKVLFVDFDNTLWNGVMADGAVEQYLEQHKLLRRLKDAGVLLVALSKNDPRNIRWNEMVLQPEDFAVLKINWNLKAQSIQETAEELDLGVDSFVVIDDSAQERALIAERFPRLIALDPTEATTWGALELMLRFPNTRETEESRGRTELYRAQAERRRSQSDSSGLDYGAMMASLKLRVKFRKARTADLERLTELVQRTNQFNTTTRRYTRQEIAAFMTGDDHEVYTAEVTDKFGSFGLVAVVVVARQGGSAITFESFVMSCRAMGFGLEQAFLRLVLDAESAAGARGLFIPTDRNAPSSQLFADNGFHQSDEVTWTLENMSSAPQIPAWITVES
ncbi:MAG: hypothetical protein LBG44_07595 [Gemmatimonadota bacterium]|jgi:FkbH-like protein|nr:hypothetical protein [Gemmatimonadota bacterium]